MGANEGNALPLASTFGNAEKTGAANNRLTLNRTTAGNFIRYSSTNQGNGKIGMDGALSMCFVAQLEISFRD
jgi:hypothetical protein